MSIDTESVIDRTDWVRITGDSEYCTGVVRDIYLDDDGTEYAEVTVAFKTWVEYPVSQLQKLAHKGATA